MGRDARDITVTYSAGAEATAPPVTLRPKWRWNSPLTQAALAWIGVALSVASLIPLGQIVSPVVEVFLGAGLAAGGGPPEVGPWALAFLGGSVLAMLAWHAYGIVKRRQVRPLDSLGILPAAWGREGRLGIARLGGTCPTCGGSLRLQNLPVDAEGRGISRKEPFALCANNGRHRWPFDVTATVDQDAE